MFVEYMGDIKTLIELSEIASKQLLYFKEENKRLVEENLRLLEIITNLTNKVHERSKHNNQRSEV